MKRLKALLLLIIIISSVAYADSSYVGSGSPSARENPEVTHTLSFFYDPTSSQRLTFGFTDSTDLTWEDNADYGDRFFNLKTAYVRDNITYGYGNINFYWKLKTNDVVDAKLYLEGPLRDPSTGVELNWSLSFNAKENDNSSIPGISNVEEYGISNGKTVYTKNPDSSEIQIGYVPVRITTAESDPSVGDQNYIGTVGVLVEIK